MSNWAPVVYRGDGAWIGLMPGGKLGVGVETEGRATLEDSNFVPMWPFMERDLSECLQAFSGVWQRLDGAGVATPQRLIELTAETAWNSGREYWMWLSVAWVVQMAAMPAFDPQRVRDTAARMLELTAATLDLKRDLQRVVDG